MSFLKNTYLDEEFLQELLVGCLVVLQLLSDLLLHGLFQLMNVLVDFAHSLDSSHVLLL